MNRHLLFHREVIVRNILRAVMCLVVGCVATPCGSAQRPIAPSVDRLGPDVLPAVELPDTPAGELASAWLKAIQSGKREAIRTFVLARFGKPPQGDLPADPITDQFLGLSKATGGFVVAKVVTSKPTSITLFVQAKRTGYGTEVRFDATTAKPPLVAGLSMTPVEAPADLLPKSKLSEREIRNRADTLVATLEASDAFSGVVLIAKDGKPIYERASGLASKAWNAKNRPDTKFNLASMSKMFTAVAVAQLVGGGKLSYDDTVGNILPDYPNKDVATKVTVHHLLTHTSGLPAADATVEQLLSSYKKGYRTVEEYLPTFTNERLQSEPGKRFAYSNYGYLVLGRVIEKASGQDYHTYLRKNVFGPVGMSDTDSYELDADTPNLATGYMDTPGGRRTNVRHLAVKGMPFGGGYSTAGDLAKFATALQGEKLLPCKAVERLWKGQVNDGQYGYGFEVREYNGRRIAGHGGGWFGITNHMDIYHDLGYTVVILSNYDVEAKPIAMKFREWLTAGVK
jgi:CubicO group peptidase (beta-lactamase class C family)